MDVNLKAIAPGQLPFSALHKQGWLRKKKSATTKQPREIEEKHGAYCSQRGACYVDLD